MSIRDILAFSSFEFVRFHCRVASRLGVSAYSTGRPFETYRQLFYSGDSESAVFNRLQDKVIADIGCGLTPFLSDSMFQKCRMHNIDFFAVDPKLEELKEPVALDRILARVTGSSGQFAAPGAFDSHLVTAWADNLPFEDNSVDEIISSMLLGIWITDPEMLDKAITEFWRVLKPGGTIRIYPTPPPSHSFWNHLRRNDSSWQQTFFSGARVVAATPPGYTAHLRKLS